MYIIPAIDIKEGKCVRLYQGDFERLTIYDDDPVPVARRWVEQGAQMLHVVDLDGARVGHPVNTHNILEIVQSVNVPVQIGGGLRDEPADLAEHMAALGVRRVIYTDISRDGTLSEPNYAATSALVRPDGPRIIAAGGVGKLEHLQQLAEIGVEATIVGKALYTGDIRLAEAI